MSGSQRKKYILIASIAVVVILLISIVDIISRNNTTDNTNTGSNTANQTSSSAASDLNETKIINGTTVTDINGYDDTIKNLPSSEKDLIITVLANTIANNGISNTQIDDASVRNNTYNQSVTDTSKSIYYTEFIVDIPSIKQSYKVGDYYSPLPTAKSNLYDYTVLVSCLEQSELIYGNFECTDRLKQEQGE